jgi:thiamine biosynthesis lipoprotein
MSTIDASAQVHSLRGQTMGTFWSLRLVAAAGFPVDAVQSGVQAELDRVDASMSTYKHDSELSRFNAATAGSWHTLSGACFDVVEHALQLARDTDGAYDPTVGPLVNAWGFGPGAAQHGAPSDEVIAAARERIGWWRIERDATTRRIRQPGGAYIDLSSIAKGYAVDVVGDWLKERGVTAWLVEVGGEMKAYGSKPDSSSWRVGIEMPDAPDRYFCTLALKDMAIATSGDYRRRFADGDGRYSHHIDARSGRPVPYAVASVSVLAPSALQADPLGTAMTLLGPDRGLAYAQSRNLAVLFVLRTQDGLEPRLTPAFAAALQA